MPEIHIPQNKLDKAFFQHDAAYGDFKDLPRRTAYEKVLREKHLMLHLKSTIWWIWKRSCFIDWSSGVAIKRKIVSNR